VEIEVLIFGPQAALAGARAVRVAVAAERATAAEVLAALGAASPALEPSLRGSRLAVNHAFVGSGSPIGPGDEVALIGMVSGG
jgi:molybdopterin converting factor small subunit